MSEKVADIAVGERSGITIPTRYAFKNAGYPEIIKKHKIKTYYFDEVSQVPIQIGNNQTLRNTVYVPQPIARTDFLINLPKFKAHRWCRLTLSLKNFIGIQDDRHRLVDHNLFFEQKIADLQAVIQPKFIAIDAISAGQKMMLTPTPFPMGAIVMGTNSCAVDTVGCHMVHVDPQDLLHLKYASQRGLGPMDLDEIEVSGDYPLAEIQSKTALLEARLIAHPDGKGEEQYVLCRSTARAEKERAMLARQTEKLCAELQKIDTALREKHDPKSGAIERRIGRWLGKYPAAAKVVQAVVERDDSGAACALTITSHVEKGRWKDKAHGAYLLRTNCTETDPAKLWRWYIQLTQAEAAFRTAKSDLKLRPIYHHKTERVEAHILVCFLALAMWRVLEQWMHGKGLGTCARKLIAEISTIKSMDIVLPVRRGEAQTELTIRTVARPDRHVAELLARLDLELPTRNRILAVPQPGNSAGVGQM